MARSPIRRRSLRQNANVVSRRRMNCEGSRTRGTGSSNPSPSSRESDANRRDGCSRLPRGDPEPADPVGRARGSRTICTAKWCIYVTSPAPAVEGLGAAMSLSTDRQPGANP